MQVLKLVIGLSGKLVELVGQAVDDVRVSVYVGGRQVGVLGHLQEEVADQFSQLIWVLYVGVTQSGTGLLSFFWCRVHVVSLM